MRLRRRKILQETVELNITAFLNLMVVLVPFLLITAVFSRMTVLELTLPGGEADPQTAAELQLQMLVYPDRLEFRDAQLGRISEFALDGEEINWARVDEVLLQIKSRFPDNRAITLLLHPEVDYRRLIEIMDRVSIAQVVNQATLEEYELFPDIAIGSAPSSPADSQISLEDLGEQIRAREGEGHAR